MSKRMNGNVLLVVGLVMILVPVLCVLGLSLVEAVALFGWPAVVGIAWAVTAMVLVVVGDTRVPR